MGQDYFPQQSQKKCSVALADMGKLKDLGVYSLAPFGLSVRQGDRDRRTEL
jgi:hypothetical protein